MTDFIKAFDPFQKMVSKIEPCFVIVKFKDFLPLVNYTPPPPFFVVAFFGVLS